MNPQNPYTMGFSPYTPTQNQSGGNTGSTGFFGGGYSPYSQMNLLPTIPISGGPQGGFFSLPSLPIRRPPNPMVPPQDQPQPELPPGLGTPRIDPIFSDYRAIDPTQPTTPPRGEVYTPPPLPDLSNYPPQVRDAIELERQRDLGLAPRPAPPVGLPDVSDTFVDMPRVEQPPRLSAQEQAQEILKMAVRRVPADLQYDLNGDGRITSADALAYLKQHTR